MARIDMAELRAALGRFDHRDLTHALGDVDPTDVLAALFPVDDSHDADRTVAAATAVAALVRHLNYATRGAHGTPDPQTLDRIVAHLEAAAAGLEQTTGQMAQRLEEFARKPRLASDGMAYEELTPAQIADRAAVALRDARDLLGQLHATLSEAHNLVARLYIRNDGEES